MSSKLKTVEHLGKVAETTKGDVMVKIISHSACSACRVKNACGMADTAEKIVVVNKPDHNYSINQEVKVILKQSLGFRALLMGYVVPFLIVLFTLVLLTLLKVPEGRAGVASLAVLAPYYISLYIFKDRISKQFYFDIEKIN